MEKLCINKVILSYLILFLYIEMHRQFLCYHRVMGEGGRGVETRSRKFRNWGSQTTSQTATLPHTHNKLSKDGLLHFMNQIKERRDWAAAPLAPAISAHAHELNMQD